jgi:hypothetical protein
MIIVQLAPAVELEDKEWWQIDFAAFVVIAVLGYFGITGYLNIRILSANNLVAATETITQEMARMAPTLLKLDSINTDKEKVNARIAAIRAIVDSKVQKVKALVALDQLQTLWMDGVWYRELEYSAEGLVNIKGAGFDSLFVGEYMLGVGETMNQETKNDDVRTRLGFDRLVLKQAVDPEKVNERFPDIDQYLDFELTGVHVEKPDSTTQNVPAISSLRRGDKHEL